MILLSANQNTLLLLLLSSEDQNHGQKMLKNSAALKVAEVKRIFSEALMQNKTFPHNTSSYLEPLINQRTFREPFKEH